MAATAAGARLTEEHRLAQVVLSQDAARLAGLAWDQVDTADLYVAGRVWAAQQSQLLTAQRLASVELAARYAQLFRVLELGSPLEPGGGLVQSRLSTLPAQRFAPSLAASIGRAGRFGAAILAGLAGDEDFIQSPESTQALFAALLVNGPAVVFDALNRGFTIDQALATAKVRIAGVVQRYTLDGGRGVLMRVFDIDPLTVRWARVTSGNPCAFCAAMASRGFVYSTQASAMFDAHDHCACSAELGYEGQDAVLPASAENAQASWAAYKKSRKDHPEWYADLPGAYQSGENRGYRRTASDAGLLGFRRFLEYERTGVEPPARERPEKQPPPIPKERVELSAEAEQRAAEASQRFDDLMANLMENVR